MIIFKIVGVFFFRLGLRYKEPIMISSGTLMFLHICSQKENAA